MAGGIDKKKLNQKEDVNISTITTFNPNLTAENETFEADICIFAVNIFLWEVHKFLPVSISSILEIVCLPGKKKVSAGQHKGNHGSNRRH